MTRVEIVLYTDIVDAQEIVKRFSADDVRVAMVEMDYVLSCVSCGRIGLQCDMYFGNGKGDAHDPDIDYFCEACKDKR